MLVPAWQSVHVDPLGGETHAHVPVTTLGDDLDLEVVQTARGGDRMRGPHRGGVFVGFAVT